MSSAPESTPPQATRGVRITAYRRFWIIAWTVLFADQATKLLVVAKLPYNALHSHAPGAGIDVIPGFFHLIHVGNTGAAWSMLSGRSLLHAALAAVTLAGIYFWRHSLGLRERAGQNAFGLLCGGVAGNLIDRIAHGHVVDFLDFHFGRYIYPTFNVADSGICVGVGLYLWHSLRSPSPHER
jgi:signal peptidase II